LTWAKTSGKPLHHGAAPELKISPGHGGSYMFRGMTIEELIKSVERAEQHARDARELKVNFNDYPVRRMEMRELIEVA
jgi:hypothetical protein